MYKTHCTSSLAVILSFLTFCLIPYVTVKDVKAESYTINDIEVSRQDNNMFLLLKGNSVPAFTQYELFSPTRLVVDIAEAEISEAIDLASIIPKNEITTLNLTVLRDKTPQITRFELTLAESYTYQVNKVDTNIAIRLFPKKPEERETARKTVLQGLEVSTKGTITEIMVNAGTAIENYTSGTVTGRTNIADSLYIDINEAEGTALEREKHIGRIVDKIRVAPRGSGVRLVFDSAREALFAYDIKTVPQGLLVTVTDNTSIRETEKSPEDPTLNALISSSEAIVEQSAKAQKIEKSAEEKIQDSFGFSGYEAKRISVDFYKIDLHNVFRLFRQISDVNIVVDESVSGSLTLALSDVPWNFALDIILNLKGLKKEERHNTIVIYPAQKSFTWPEMAQDNLSFKADVETIQQEAMVIQQSENQPAEIMQAKELIRKAKTAEDNNDIEDAVAIYEQAFKLWPQNSKISRKLAELYLVDLGINAKAAHFAKESLALNKKDYQAALYAAIASANMDDISAATDYFARSISGTPPLKEALISYAAFSEKKDQPEAAIKLLNRYADTYSDTVETMTARARLYDAIGQKDKATAQYKALLYSGYQLVPDLKKYIRGRLTMNQDQMTN